MMGNSVTEEAREEMVNGRRNQCEEIVEEIFFEPRAGGRHYQVGTEE